MARSLRWEWAIGIELEELTEQHLQSAYKLNWDSLCKFDSCRKNCKRILCLACFDRSWIDNESANSSGYDEYEITNYEQKRKDLKTFVGLKNLGATCYVNCLLQLWFHNPALRKAIYEWDKSCSYRQQGSNTNNINKRMTLDQGDTNVDSQNTAKLSSKRLRDDDSPMKSSPNKKSNNKTSSQANSSNNNNNKQLVLVTEPQQSVQKPTQSVDNNKSKDDLDPIEELQLVFARLQFTNKKSIDPMTFITSLKLDSAEQQDAQEFGNLFMELLEKSFANQNDSFVSKIIQNQFCGRYSYATICDNCKHSSLSDSTFYELDLSIQNLETLHDCLNEFFRPVPLDGKYNCSRCKEAQSAHRKIILKSLPPTLNLQLLRFVYDVQRNVRQKLNSYIIFPEILDMNPYLKGGENSKSKAVDVSARTNNNNHDGNYLSYNGTSSRSQSNIPNIYILSAVLIHRGSSPHSGHYIAHIKDRVTKDWYKFNDDSVERIGPQLQVSTDGESITIVEDRTENVRICDPVNGKVSRIESKSLKSKTAYMLVYQAQDNEALTYPSDHSEKWMLPEHLQTAVAEENSRSEEIFESLQVAKELDQRIIDVRKNQIRTIYEKLVCRDPSDKFEFIDKAWLQNWLTNSSTNAKFPPIDNSSFLCIHDKLDFRKVDQVKCVRSEGVDMLYKEFGGGPRLQDAMCHECVKLEVRLIQFRDRMKDDQKYITSQAKFKLGADYDFADAYIVGKNSYRDWQALVMCQFEKSYPELSRRTRESSSSGNHQSSDEDESKVEKNPKESQENGDKSNSDSDDEAMEKFVFNSDILCEHNQLINDTSAWRIVPKEVWMIFKRYFGNDPSMPLIEYNANTIMCAECKRQEVEQQEIGDVLKQEASRQKSKLPDLFHNRKRTSWCSMQLGENYYALERQFVTKWQKFIRNPSHQEQPTAVKNREKLICEHRKCLYNFSNSNPVLPECPFLLISSEEYENLKQYYSFDYEIKFYIDLSLAGEKLPFIMAKTNGTEKSSSDQSSNNNNCNNSSTLANTKEESPTKLSSNEEVDVSEFDWSECVVSEPDYCSSCHEMIKQDELKKLLNYESATIYITKVEGSPITYGPHNNPNLISNSGQISKNTNCDNESSNAISSNSKQNDLHSIDANSGVTSKDEPEIVMEEHYPFKRRKKIYIEDEANDFVPPGAVKQPAQVTTPSNSILRRTPRRNRNRDQAYTIKPSQTLLELKKEIFQRCQVLPSDQRLFLNDVLLGDNSKTMSQLRIVPNCSLKLEVDRPTCNNVDLIEDEPTSRKSCAQPETGFKGSLLLSNSHF